jgi:type II secretion system protein G
MKTPDIPVQSLKRLVALCAKIFAWGVLACVFSIAVLVAGLFAMTYLDDNKNRNPARGLVTSDEMTVAGEVSAFRLDCGRFPSAAEGLNGLVSCPPGLKKKWLGPYLTKNVPKDPWGRFYLYRYPGSSGKASFSILSYGSDGEPGGTGTAADIEYDGGAPREAL